MWFTSAPADVGFADASKQHFTYDFHVHGPPADVFVAITDPATFARWFPDFRAAHWVSGTPPGPGSVREVRLRALAVRERILVWEPGKRFAFTVISASQPLLARMVEDYRLTANEQGGTRVQWTVAYQPRLVVRPLAPLLRPVFGRLFRRACDELRRYLEGRQAD